MSNEKTQDGSPISDLDLDNIREQGADTNSRVIKIEAAVAEILALVRASTEVADTSPDPYRCRGIALEESSRD